MKRLGDTLVTNAWAAGRSSADRSSLEDVVLAARCTLVCTTTNLSEQMKEAIATVSQHSHSSESLTDPHSDFGANEWLVDEMYDQYLKDKNSVDASWQRYFAAHPAAERRVR